MNDSSDTHYTRLLPDDDSGREAEAAPTNAGYFNESSQKVAGCIMHLQSLVQGLSNAAHPERSMADEARALAEDIRVQLQHMEEHVSTNKGQASVRRQRRFQVKKITKDFARVGAGLEAALRHVVFVEEHNTKTTNKIKNQGSIGWAGSSNGEQTVMSQEMQERQQEQDSAMYTVRVEQQMTQHLIEEQEERAVEMQRLQSNVVKVNEIFRDIANMVEEQSEQIDMIEINVDNATEQTNSAMEQLNKAVRRQKVTRRGLAFFLACFLGFVIVCIVLAQQPWADN